MTAFTSFAQFVTFLNEQGVPNGANLVEQVVELPVQTPPLEDVVHIRWEKALPYIQLICVMVRDVAPDRVRAIETACCVANNTIALPGFGFDYSRRSVYFRQTVLVKDSIDSDFLKQMVLAVATNARQFLIPFRRVAAGENGELILDFAVGFAQADAPPPPTAKA